MMLVTPEMCYHSFIELYFEPVSTEKQACQTNCSFCRGDTREFTGRFIKKKLQSILSTKVLASGKTPHYQSFVKSLKANKSTIFHANDIPAEKMGQIHALMLRLLAKGVIVLGISDSTQTGTMDLNDSHVILYLPNGIDDDGTQLPTHTIDLYWDGLNWVQY